MTGARWRHEIRDAQHMGMRGDWDARLPVVRDDFNRWLRISSRCKRRSSPDVDQAAQMLGSGYYLAQQQSREADGQGITTASRWPFGPGLRDRPSPHRTHPQFRVHLPGDRKLGPEPFGRIWVANHFPDYQLAHERERRIQAVAVARQLEPLLVESPGHVIVAGDMDADDVSDSMRFWTGRHVIDYTSVCYRNVWEAAHPTEPLATYVPKPRTKSPSTGPSTASTTSSSVATPPTPR